MSESEREITMNHVHDTIANGIFNQLLIERYKKLVDKLNREAAQMIEGVPLEILIKRLKTGLEKGEKDIVGVVMQIRSEMNLPILRRKKKRKRQ